MWLPSRCTCHSLSAPYPVQWVLAGSRNIKPLIRTFIYYSKMSCIKKISRIFIRIFCGSLFVISSLCNAAFFCVLYTCSVQCHCTLVLCTVHILFVWDTCSLHCTLVLRAVNLFCALYTCSMRCTCVLCALLLFCVLYTWYAHCHCTSHSEHLVGNQVHKQHFF